MSRIRALRSSLLLFPFLLLPVTTAGPGSEANGASRPSSPSWAEPEATPPPVVEFPKPAPASAVARFDAALESGFLELTNRARADRGLATLGVRDELVALARQHSLDMVNRRYFSHYSPEGLDPGARAFAGGVTYAAFAENLARIGEARDPGALALEGWLLSPAHRRNLLDEGEVGYTATGIGVAVAPDGEVLATQLFAR